MLPVVRRSAEMVEVCGATMSFVPLGGEAAPGLPNMKRAKARPLAAASQASERLRRDGGVHVPNS